MGANPSGLVEDPSSNTSVPRHPIPPPDGGEPDRQTALHRFLATGERDLQRLVLDIHDGPVQYLFAAVSQMKIAATKLEAGSDGERRIKQGLRLVEQALHEIRDLVGAFRPPGFERRPLGEIMDGLAVQHEAMTDQRVDLMLAPNLGDCALPIKIAIYRITQEALANGHRHGGADRQRVELRRDRNELQLTVADEGQGFDVARALQAEADVAIEGGHYGLRGMQDRVNVLGGRFTVRSVVGQGTTVTVVLPCQ